MSRSILNQVRLGVASIGSLLLGIYIIYWYADIILNWEIPFLFDLFWRPGVGPLIVFLFIFIFLILVSIFIFVIALNLSILPIIRLKDAIKGTPTNRDRIICGNLALDALCGLFTLILSCGSFFLGSSFFMEFLSLSFYFILFL